MKYKFTAVAIKWFDKVNGNTYHSVRVTNNKTGAVIACPFQYGYGEQYKHTALQAMADVKWLPAGYRELTYLYERENDYPINWIVSGGLKRECVANGVVS